MSQSYDRISIYGLWDYDNTIFDNFSLPEDLASSKEDIINNIFLECGELEVLYTDPNFMKIAIGVWSRKMLPGWNKMLAALTASYNPIHNFDRNETYTDQETISASHSGTSSGTDSSTVTDSGSSTTSTTESGSTSNKNEVNGFNLSEGWSDHDRSTGTTSGTTSGTGTTSGSTTSSGTSSGTDSSTDSSSRTLGHQAHLSGNIGLTSSQDMVRWEVSLREDLNIIGLITNDFKKTFCVLVY